jgi:hypothetical protein
MTIRFLATTPSDAPEFPFQPGQEIPVPEVTDRVARWLRDGLAVVVREEPELATVAVSERAVMRHGKRRHK